MTNKATRQSFNNIKHVTIIKTWSWQEFEIDKSVSEFNIFYENALNNWIEWVFISSLGTYLKFKSIESFYWKMVRIGLPEPYNPRLYEMWSEEKRILLEKNPEKYYELEREDNERRQKIAEIIAESRFLSLERRQEIRLEKRLNFLRELEKLEKSWWLETTLSQLERLRKLENEERKRILENKN